MADTSVKVTFLGDAKKLAKTIDGVEKDIGGLEKSSKSFSDKFSGAMSKTLPVLAGVGAGVAVLGTALKAAIEDEAEQKRLAETLRNVAGATNEQIAATEKWIDTTQRATGVADSELRPAFDKLVRSSKDMETAQKNLAIAMDVSQGTGKDLDTVAQALAKVLEGNTTAAARLVPELTGIAREGASADEIMASLAETFKGQTNVHAETAEGKMARLNIAFDEMKEKLGEKLLPIFLQFSDWLIEKGIPKIEEIAGKIDEWWARQDDLRSMLKKTAEILQALIEDVKTFVGWIQAAIDAVDSLAKKLNSLPDKLFGLKTGFGVDRDPENPFVGVGIKGKAAGGPVAGGTPYIVGERGPELFVPGGSGSIVPNHQMGGITINMTVQGSVLSERDLVGVLNNALRRGLVIGG